MVPNERIGSNINFLLYFVHPFGHNNTIEQNSDSMISFANEINFVDMNSLIDFLKSGWVNADYPQSRYLDLVAHEPPGGQGQNNLVLCAGFEEKICDGSNECIFPHTLIAQILFVLGGGHTQQMFQEITLNCCDYSARASFDLLKAVWGRGEWGQQETLLPGLWEGGRALENGLHQWARLRGGNLSFRELFGQCWRFLTVV